MLIKRLMNRIAPCLWLLFGLGWDVWYHIVRGKIMLDSDMSSEMIVASILNKEHSLTGLTKSWGYSTVLNFFDTQWFYRIGLWISPDNWHVARTIGIIMAIIFLAFTMWLLFFSIGHPEWGIWAAALTVFPGGAWWFWQTIYGGYYIIYAAAPLLAFSFIILAEREKTVFKRFTFSVASVIISLLVGMNGIRSMMFFYAPFILAVFLIYILRARQNGMSVITGENKWFLILSVVSTLGALAGYLINTRILSDIYSFRQYSDSPIEYESILEFLRLYFWSFGFADEKELMSASGIASMCGLAFGFIVFLSGIRLIFRYKELSEQVQILTAVSISCILFSCFVFAYVSGHGAMQYFQPVIPFGYCLVVLEIQTEKYKFKHSSFVVSNAVICILLIASAGTIHNEHNGSMHKYRAKPTLGPIVDMLIDKGYTQGVSLFWSSNIVEELSNGKIEMWTLDDDSDINDVSPNIYQSAMQRVSHKSNHPDGRYFYIFDYDKGEDYEWYDKETEVGLAYVQNHPYPSELQPIYYDGLYVVYGN